METAADTPPGKDGEAKEAKVEEKKDAGTADEVELVRLQDLLSFPSHFSLPFFPIRSLLTPIVATARTYCNSLKRTAS